MNLTVFIAAIATMLSLFGIASAASAAKDAYVVADTYKSQAYDAIDCATKFTPGGIPDLANCEITGIE